MRREDSLGRRRFLLGAAAAAAGAATGLAAPAAHADEYPSKPIRLILPNSPGSSVDKVSRVLATPLGMALGQPVVVENLPGSGGLIGMQQLLRAPKDGYTIGIVSSNYSVGPYLYDLPYDSLKDITPVSILVSGPFVLLVSPKIPARTLAEFIALAKSRPADATLTFGSPGVGTSFHLSGELLNVTAGTRLLHVPYKMINNYVTDLVGGQLDSGFLTANVAAPLIKAGKLRPLAVTTPTRSRLLPDVPTIAESGYPDFNVDGWQGLIVAAGTPRAIAEKLNAEMNRALRMPDVVKVIEDDGHRIVGGSLADAADWFARDFDRIGKLAKAIGLKPE
ncbi:tripartite tricarboxylate transporter substrate binding protein [Pigmentiphaga soli]|uniref:Tripartite tricarboxylate transporter substrate binding protein n=1 Tax=Pigmentiphaga soli TaxID=1007095 RepID=A0ABP8HEV1_9BURK